MSDLPTEEIYSALSMIVSKFKLYECVECAEAVLAWLKENKIEGKLVRLKTRYEDEDFILSDRMESIGVLNSITQNGFHYGVEVRGRIFDNLSRQGLSVEEWQKDFHCASEAFVIEELEGFR